MSARSVEQKPVRMQRRMKAKIYRDCHHSNSTAGVTKYFDPEIN